MKPLLDRVRSGEILVADGAMGTLLMRRGLLTGRCPEEVNLTHPAALEEIARQYLGAGAEIIQTNTFGGSPLKLAMNGLDGRTEEINRRAVQAVRQGVGDRAYVAASCGPSGRMLQPHGDLDLQVLYDSFRRQIAALVEAGVDAICVETMIDLEEAKAAVRAAKDVSPKTPVMAMMTFDATPRGFYTVMGVSVEAAAAGLAEAGADIVGSNCGHGIENMVRIAAEFRRHTRLPILIQSNAGLPVMQDGKPEWPETPEFMAGKVPDLLAAGVSIIGGCCGTTPEHIRAIRQAVDRAVLAPG
jgi:5-methyltetrahydrofolate--homocysteine methyltransferase